MKANPGIGGLESRGHLLVRKGLILIVLSVFALATTKPDWELYNMYDITTINDVYGQALTIVVRGIFVVTLLESVRVRTVSEFDSNGVQISLNLGAWTVADLFINILLFLVLLIPGIVAVFVLGRFM